MSGGPELAALPGLPPHAPGMRVGLFGGSFNPVHDGHRLVVRECVRRLGLDAVWVLVSPGNPLKDHAELADLSERLRRTAAVMDHPRAYVTGFEAPRGFRYTYQTVSHLRRRARGVRFVWIMGADSLASFHRWERWRDIAGLVPIAVYERPGARFQAMGSPAARALERFRLPEAAAAGLALCAPPAWVYLHGLTSALSSTRIRGTAPPAADRHRSGLAPAETKRV